MNNKSFSNKLNLDFVRNQFPALQNDFIYMDNAGGSQTLQAVIDRISDYLINFDVQLGASYKVSAQAQELLDQSVSVIGKYLNARRPEEVIVGPSTTMLLRVLSICLARTWKPGDEVIITNSDHEANVSCWVDLEQMGIVLKTWKVNPDTLEFDIDDLNKLLTCKTRLVAMVHASNILGTINPIEKIAGAVHSAGALFCVDGVAFAPHRLIDVQQSNVDFYVFSTYKTYGPHLAVMYGRYDLLRPLDGLNHYFIGKEEVPYKFQPGNINYELTYSLPAIYNYIQNIGDDIQHHSDLTTRQQYAGSFGLIADHEEYLSSLLLDFLTSNPEIKIIGHADPDKTKRVPTISFVHNSLSSAEVVRQVDPFNIGIRFGDFYAKKIINDLGLQKDDGVIRVSLVHYNTENEVQKLISVFEEIF